MTRERQVSASRENDHLSRKALAEEAVLGPRPRMAAIFPGLLISPLLAKAVVSGLSYFAEAASWSN